MIITDVWGDLPDRRCGSKNGYWKEEVAKLNAQRASIQAHALIVAYLCPDCGMWHIGHAPRNLATLGFCAGCGGTIPKGRKGNTCSRSCKKVVEEMKI